MLEYTIPRISKLSPDDYRKLSNKRASKKECLYVVTDVDGNVVGSFNKYDLGEYFKMLFESLKIYIGKNKRVHGLYYINKENNGNKVDK